MNQMPIEVIILIFRCLKFQDGLRLSKTGKYLHNIFDECLIHNATDECHQTWIRSIRQCKLLAITKFIRYHSIDPAFNDNFAIKHVCFYGLAEILKLLLSDSRVDPTVDDNYPFRIACQLGHVAIVKLLLEIASVDPCADHNYAIISAFNSGSFEICSIIFRDHRFDRANLQESAIHVGDDVKLLLEKMDAE
jgi:hypothetical protein